MLKGKINLTLMIGPAVPLPVPQVVMDALTDITVTSAATGQSGFQLTFTLSNKSPLHTMFMLSGGSMLPIIRVMIIITINGMPEVLMDGLMTEHRVTPGSQPGQSKLTVMGKDLSIAMNYIDFSGLPYPAMPPEAQVAVILAKYAVFGIIPVIIPSPMMDIPIPIERIPRHQGKDLEHLQMLADEVGYTFYVTPGPVPGVNIAYWGPEIKVGVPQPALTLDPEIQKNVESINFNYKSDQAKLPILWIQNPQSGVPIPVPIPNVNPLQPPLGVIPPLPKDIDNIEGTSGISPIRAVMIGLAKAAKSADVVEGEGTLDVLRYGRVLKSRGLVGVRGAGMAFDGLYFVKSVTHSIKRGEYKQSFSLSRNALVSITPKVVP
jgi:hypothetical protein